MNVFAEKKHQIPTFLAVPFTVKSFSFRLSDLDYFQGTNSSKHRCTEYCALRRTPVLPTVEVALIYRITKQGLRKLLTAQVQFSLSLSSTCTQASNTMLPAARNTQKNVILSCKNLNKLYYREVQLNCHSSRSKTQTNIRAPAMTLRSPKLVKRNVNITISQEV